MLHAKGKKGETRREGERICKHFFHSALIKIAQHFDLHTWSTPHTPPTPYNTAKVYFLFFAKGRDKKTERE